MSIVKTEETCLEHPQNLPRSSLKSARDVSGTASKSLGPQWSLRILEQGDKGFFGGREEAHPDSMCNMVF